VSGVIVETAMERLSPEAFPQLRFLGDVDDVEAVRQFGLETLVAGLRAQVQSRAIAAGLADSEAR
jgi:hypothetical protein